MKHLISSLAIGATLFAPMTALAQTVTVSTGDLIKGSGQAVYYLYDGQRLVFPTEKTYKTWYADYSSVKTLTDAQLMTYSLKANVTYRPGIRLVKITTDPKVYAIAKGGTLRWVQNEAVAKLLFGTTWATQVDDIPDAFFVNYRVGDPIASPGDFSPSAEQAKAPTIWQDKDYANPNANPMQPQGYGY